MKQLNKFILMAACLFLFQEAVHSNSPKLESNEAVLYIVGTNDIHGSFSNFDWFVGYVNALRKHALNSYGERGTVILLDGGDATQGTLLSNYSEGQTAIRLMNRAGYAAAVAGNHAFDFGPKDWRVDKCPEGNSNCDPLEMVRLAAREANFPFVATNVVETNSNKIPHFYQPYVLAPFFGSHIAILGLENQATPSTTVPQNVKGLKFSRGVNEIGEQMLKLYASGQADVFILVAHEGDREGEGQLKDFLVELNAKYKRPDGSPFLNAVVGGHTHQLNEGIAAGTPYLQSGANGEFFGLIRLVVHRGVHDRLEVRSEKTDLQAGIKIESRNVRFYGEDVAPDAATTQILRSAEAEVAELANKKLAVSTKAFSRAQHRTADSETGNLVADLMQQVSGAAFAMIGSGDIRNGLPKGDVLYQHFFEMMPKNLELVRLKAAPLSKVIDNLAHSISSCGRRGALQISNLILVFTRNCQGNTDVDRTAKLLKVIDGDGNVIYENGSQGKKYFMESVDLATSDFVMTGGAGYRAFTELKPDQVSPGLRELMVERVQALGRLDPNKHSRGRYINCLEDKENPYCP